MIHLGQGFRRTSRKLGLSLLLGSATFWALAEPTAAASLQQEAYLKSSLTQSGDAFGVRVATSGDTVAVSSAGRAIPSLGSMVHIYVRSSAGFSLQAFIQSPDPNAPDKLLSGGLALEGDTLALGVLPQGVTGTGSAVHILERSGTSWNLQSTVAAASAEAGDAFGSPIALSGDTLVVSASGDDSAATGVNGDASDNSSTDSGAVYVFVRSGATWIQQAYIKASNTGAGDRFGSSVAISGDTLVVGATSEDSAATGVNGNGADNGALNSGAAYVFVRTGTTWTQQAYLKPSNTDIADFYGSTVDIDGDTVVVGSYGEDSNAVGVNGIQANNSAQRSGAAYVYVRSGGAWSQQAYLKASNTEAEDLFGRSVSIQGDRIAVGAPFESSNATGVNGNQASNRAFNSGAVYLFERQAGAWSQAAYVKASNPGAGHPEPELPEPGDIFSEVDISSTLLVVGARLEDSGATLVNGDQRDNSQEDSGAAYVFAFEPLAAPCFTDEFDDDELDAGWTLVELGDAGQGQAVETGGRLQLTGDGTVFFAGSTDNGVFLRRPEITGDFRAELEVTGFPANFGGPYRKLGLMARASDAPNAARVFLAYVPDWENSGRPVLQFRYRTATGATGDGALGSNIYDLQLPLRIALERSGNTFRIFYQTAGSSLWRQPRGGSQGSITLPSFGSSSTLVGPFVASYDANVVVTAEAEDFSLCPLEAGSSLGGTFSRPARIEPERPGDREKPPGKDGKE